MNRAINKNIQQFSLVGSVLMRNELNSIVTACAKEIETIRAVTIFFEIQMTYHSKDLCTGLKFVMLCMRKSGVCVWVRSLLGMVEFHIYVWKVIQKCLMTFLQIIERLMERPFCWFGVLYISWTVGGVLRFIILDEKATKMLIDLLISASLWILRILLFWRTF